MRLQDGRHARIVFTDRSVGDLGQGSAGADLDRRRSQVAPWPWTTLQQVHGATAVIVEHPGAMQDAPADAAVTSCSGAVLAVQTADCAPIALVAEAGAIGVVHAGWRGLAAGVIPAAVDALRRLADGPCRAVLGPCIGPECYEFGTADLDLLAERFGPDVRSATSDGRPALDLRAAVAAALAEVGVPLDDRAVACTACGGRWFSHRARGEVERQVVAAWIESAR